METTTERVPTDTIFEILRDRICLLDYPPGTVLREAKLAAEFGISRTPIRGVLQRLAHDGLIVTHDGVGTIVTDLSYEEGRDIYRMRLKLAELIGEMAPRPFTNHHSKIIETLNQRAAVLLRDFDITEYWQINHDLHFLISDIIGNSALRQMWDQSYFQSARMWYGHAQSDPAGVATSLVAELSEVSRAIIENDAIALGYVQRNYIAYGLSRLKP